MHTGQEGRHRSSTCILNNALLRLSTVDNPRGWWRWWYLKNRPLDLDKIATRKTVSKSIFLRLEEYIRTGCSKFSRSIKKNFLLSFPIPGNDRDTILVPSSSPRRTKRGERSRFRKARTGLAGRDPRLSYLCQVSCCNCRRSTGVRAARGARPIDTGRNFVRAGVVEDERCIPRLQKHARWCNTPSAIVEISKLIFDSFLFEKIRFTPPFHDLVSKTCSTKRLKVIRVYIYIY